IRVYVGLQAARTPRERAELAVRELERTGAFERPVLAVLGTTGTGWVDPGVCQALEYMYNGDTAAVAVQYSYLPSWASFLVDRDRAAVAGRELFEAVRARWARLPAGDRPLLLVGGESLGSYALETAFDGLDDLAARTAAGRAGGPSTSRGRWCGSPGRRRTLWAARRRTWSTCRTPPTRWCGGRPGSSWNGRTGWRSHGRPGSPSR